MTVLTDSVLAVPLNFYDFALRSLLLIWKGVARKEGTCTKTGFSAIPTLLHSSLELLDAMPEHVRTWVGREGALSRLNYQY